MNMRALFLLLAAVSLSVGVGMGAFGAHGLRHSLSPAMLEVYKTAVNYQMWHGLGLGLIATVADRAPRSKLLRAAGWLMFAGILLFSGSLYILAVAGLKWLGIVTPFGGTAFLGAWLLLALHAYQSRRDANHA